VQNSLDLKLKIKKIKLAAFDVDGVMTDGSLSYLEDGTQVKTFNAKDGLGLVMLNKAGIKTAIITAKNSLAVQKRATDLNITKLFMGQKNKLEALDELCKEFNINRDEILYMGDDLPDLEVLNSVGVSTCPYDAVGEVKSSCDYICDFSGGKGAVREVCDLLLKAKNISYFDLEKPHQQ